jgi:ubiquinone/menaquinone biosynthesis C-methylase UbiE
VVTTAAPAESMTALSSAEIARLDAYQLLAALGKKLIHPGGRRSTEELFELANIEPHHKVLEVGCGPGTTAAEIAERFGANVTAVDIDPRMLEKARATVEARGLQDRITIDRQDIQALAYPDDSFDRVIVEAVTMFVDLQAAAREVVRVCRPGGIVADHEFIWRKTPTPGIRRAFQVEVCRMEFETAEMWEDVYRKAGLEDIRTISGKFVMMTPRGFVRDEGIANTLRIAGRALRRWAFVKRVVWNLKRIIPAAPYLGYVVLSGVKPSSVAAVPVTSQLDRQETTTWQK